MRPPFLLLALTATSTALVHCRPTPRVIRANNSATQATTTASGGTSPAPTTALIAPVNAAPIPVCAVQGEELISIAALSAGVASEATLARRAQGGAIAFISENAARQRTLQVAVLRADAQIDGEPKSIEGARNPSAPSIVAFQDGYAIAWRDQTDAAGQERIVVMMLDATGAAKAWPAVTGLNAITDARSPLRGKAAEWREAATVGLGPPVLATHESALVLGFSTQAATSKVVAIAIANNTATTSESSGTPSFALNQRPAFAFADGHWQWIAQDNNSPSALWSAVSGSAPTLLNRYGTNGAYAQAGTQLLHSYVTRNGSASVVRVRAAAEDSAPITTAVYAQSNTINPVPVALTSGLVGVVSLSHATDDATGSINISLVNSQGEWIGRQASLTSIRLRSSQTVVAGSPSLTGDAWVAFDARADDGNAVLAITKIACDASREANAALLPTASMRQEPAPPEEAPVSSAQPATLAQCRAQAQATTVLQHTSPDASVTNGAAAFPVVLSNGQIVLFSTRRPQPQGPLEHVAPALGTNQRVTTGPAVAASGTLLDAQLMGNNAVAITSDGWILRSTGGGTLTAIRSSLTSVGSARFVRDGSAAVVYGRTESGSASVYLLGIRNGVPSTPVQISAATSNELTIDDALHLGTSTHVLLSRSVSRVDASTRVRAVLSVGDSAASRTGLTQRDPMVDPIGIGQYRAVLHHNGPTLMMVWTDHETIRSGEIQHGMLRQPRSVFAAFPGGGQPLSYYPASNGELVVTVTLGSPVNADDMVESPYTAVVLRADTSARALSLRAPGAGVGIPSLGYAFLAHNDLQVVYAKPAGEHSMEWQILQSNCSPTGPIPHSIPPTRVQSNQPTSNATIRPAAGAAQ